MTVPRIGFVLPRPTTSTSPAELREFLQGAARAGYDYVRLLDHVVGADGERFDLAGPYDYDDPFYEPMTMAAFIAGACSLDVSTGVLVLPQRQTVLVAKQAAEIDRLTSGGLRLGIGIGWNEYEYAALGIPFERRASRFDAQVTLLRRLWQERLVDARDGFHGFEGVGLNPLPVQRPIPIWFGSGISDRSLRRIAETGDGWLPSPWLSRRDIETGWQTIRTLATTAGRNAGAVGLEGRLDVAPHAHPSLADQFSFWAGLGPTHVAVKTFDLVAEGYRASTESLTVHLSRLEEALDQVRGASGYRQHR